MSAIGDYVHLTAAEYYKHGTERFDENKTNFNLVPRIFQDQKESLKRKMESRKAHEMLSPGQQKELSKALELLMRPEGSDSQIQQLNKIWEGMLEELSDEFEGNLGNVQRDCANIFASYTFGENAKTVKTIQTKPNKGKETRKIKLQTILKRMKQLQQCDQLEQLKSQLDKIYEELAKASNQSVEALRATNYNIDNDTIELASGIDMSNLLLVESQYENVVKALNKIIARTSGSANLQKGTMFEYMLAVAPLVCGKTTVDNLHDFIKKSVVGWKKTKVSIDSSNFFKGVDLKSILNKYDQQINDHLYVSNSASQDKVDVLLRWNGKKIPLSAKNVNLKSGREIHLVSQASLLAMVADLNANYMNHFLNIVSQHKSPKDSATIQTSLINEAHHSLKRILMLEALEGYKTGAQQADFFVVNDNATGQVKIYSVAQLVLDAIDQIDNFVKVTTNGDNDIENIRFANDFQIKSYDQRITKLIGDVHAQKITVGLNPNRLN